MPDTTKTLHKAFQLLELLRQNPTGCSAQQLMTQLGMPRSTFFGLINLLKEWEIVDQVQARGNYVIGRRLLSWMGTPLPLWQEWIEAFEQTARGQNFAETVVLAFPHPQGAQILAILPSQQRLQPFFRVGEVVSGEESAAPHLFPPLVNENTHQQGFFLFEGDELIEIALPVCRDGLNPTAVVFLSAARARQDRQGMLKNLPRLRELAMHLSYRFGATVYAPYQRERVWSLAEESALSQQDIDQFLQSPLVARLACLNSEGKPHVVPVWQEWDGQSFYVAAWEGSQWAAYLRKNPAVSLTIDEPWSPLRRVVARGEAIQLEESQYPGGVSALVARLRRRYLGEAFVKPIRGRSWQAFRIHPYSLRGWKGLPLGS